MIAAHHGGNIGGKRIGRQWTGGNNHRAVERLWNVRNFLAHERDARVRGDRIRDAARELFAIDGECGTSRDARGVSGAHDDRTKTPHFLFQEPYGVIELVSTKGIAADELGELIRLVDRRRAHRAHLMERDALAPLGRLPGRFTAGEAPSDDVYHAGASSSERT